LRQRGERVGVGLHAFGRALTVAHILRQGVRQRAGLDADFLVGECDMTGHGLAPEADAGIAARRDVEDRHAFDRAHRRGIEQQFLIERERIGGAGETGAERQQQAGGNTANNKVPASKQAHKIHDFLRTGGRGCGAIAPLKCNLAAVSSSRFRE
jgi:hypothetical protein